MAEKEIFCSIGIDIDAVAGWLGSYGGEDSPDDISRGMFCGRGGDAAFAKALREVRPEDDLVHPGALHRDVPGAGKDGRRRRARGREPRLLPREPGGDDAAAGEGRTGEVPGVDRGRGRQEAGRQRGAVVGGLDATTNELLLEYDYKYDHSLQHRDFTPYYARVGDSGPRSTTPSRPRSG